MKKIEQQLKEINKDKKLMKKIEELLLKSNSYARIGRILNKNKNLICQINRKYFNIKLKHIWSKNDKIIAQKMIKKSATYKEIAEKLNKDPKRIIGLNSKYWKIKYLRDSRGYLKNLPNFNKKQKQKKEELWES